MSAVAHMNESSRTRHIVRWRWECTSHVTRIWMSVEMNESSHRSAYGSRIWMSVLWAHMNESSRAYGWGLSLIWMSLLAHMYECCRSYEWVFSRICMRVVAHMNESSRTRRIVRRRWECTSHVTRIWMCHVTDTNESCHRRYIIRRRWGGVMLRALLSRLLPLTSCASKHMAKH